MNNKIESIEVFQDLFLKFPEERRMEVRQVLGRYAKQPWRHAEEREKALTEDEDAMTFERESKGNIPNSGLTLWAESYGYNVINIVPLEIHEISIDVYNDVLNDFVDRVVQPASEVSGFDIEISARKQSITDWTSQEAADALHRFSVTANKSTGSGHPLDRKRWFKFLFSARRARGKLDSYLLERWLIEAEEWPPDVTTKLISQYEFGMSLLDEYDSSY